MHLPFAAPSKVHTVPPGRLPFPRASEGFFTIGRDARNDLAVDDMTVSRVHARLERTPAGWVLKDLSSTNGTRVNGWRVRGQVTVRAGDVVRFGDIEYTLTEDTGRDDRGDQTRVSTH
jgi:pSer/pThr/pTyr-binding forkhead associated (FHA) protein